MFARTFPFQIRFGCMSAGLVFSAFLAACEGPAIGGADRDGRDSLDAELGQDRLNRYDFLQGRFVSTGRDMDLAIEARDFSSSSSMISSSTSAGRPCSTRMRMAISTWAMRAPACRGSA